MWRAGWLHTCDSAGRKGHLVLGHPAFEVKNKRFFQDPLLDMFWDTSCGETSVDMIYIYRYIIHYFVLFGIIRSKNSVGCFDDRLRPKESDTPWGVPKRIEERPDWRRMRPKGTDRALLGDRALLH